MRIEEINAVTTEAWKNFTYNTDAPHVVTWVSYADQVLAGERWNGCCGDMTTTMLDLLTRKGLALENAYRLILWADHAKTLGHEVGCVVTDDGKFWIVGDTGKTRPYEAWEMAYIPVEYNRMSEVDPDGKATWRAGVPWSAT